VLERAHGAFELNGAMDLAVDQQYLWSDQAADILLRGVGAHAARIAELRAVKAEDAEAWRARLAAEDAQAVAQANARYAR
jgi:hypothetical protein